MQTLFKDDLMVSQGNYASLGSSNDLVPEAATEAEQELYSVLNISGDPVLIAAEQELFNQLGLSGPLLDFAKGVGQTIFNVGRAGRNAVRGVFGKPPLPNFNLKTGEMQTAVAPDTVMRITKDGVMIGNEQLATSSQVDAAYSYGYADALQQKPTTGSMFKGDVTLPGNIKVPKAALWIGGGAVSAIVLYNVIK